MNDSANQPAVPDTNTPFPPADGSLLDTPAAPAEDTTPNPVPATSPNIAPAENSTPQQVSSSGGNGRRRAVFMFGIAGLLLMVGGIVAGTFLLSGQGTFNRAVAWDCSLYNFKVAESGAVTVENGSERNLPSQLATVYVDDQQVAEFEVSALDAGEGESIGVVPVPENGQFSWRVVGNKDCDQNGSYLPSSRAECVNIKAFDEDWNPLSVQDLADFKSGDIVRFSVAGSTTQGSFEAARFTINGELRDPVTQIRPGTDEFYDEYELPEGIEAFGVTVELLHDQAGWF